MGKAVRLKVLSAIVLSLALGAAAPVAADEEPVIKVARILKYVEEGGKTVRKPVMEYIHEDAYIDAKAGKDKDLAVGAHLLVGETLHKPGNTVVILKSDRGDEINLSRRVTKWERKPKNWFRYTAGRIVAKLKSAFTFETEYGVATVRGTTFGLSAEPGGTKVTVLDGEVEFRAGDKMAKVERGHVVSVGKEGLGNVEKLTKDDVRESWLWAVEAKATAVKTTRFLFIPAEGVVKEIEPGMPEVFEPSTDEAGPTAYGVVAITTTVTRGVALLTPEEAEEALVNGTVAAVLDPKDSDAHLTLGEAYLSCQLFEEAIDEYNTAIEMGRDDARALRGLADAYNFSGNNKEAIKYYERAVEKAPDDVDLRVALVNAYVAARKIRKALEELTFLAETAEKFLAAGNVYRAEGDYERALEEYGRGLACDAENVYLLLAVAKAYYRLKKIDETIDYCQRMIAIDAEDSAVYAWIGAAFDELGKYEAAVNSYGKAIKIDPESWFLYYNRGIVFRNWGKYEKAVESYDKGIEINPKSAALYHCKGSALSKLDKYEDAIKSYDQALEIDPESHFSNEMRGLALRKLGRYEEAIKSFDKGIEINPEYPWNYYSKGLALDKLGEYEAAVESYDKGLKIDSEDAALLYNKRGTDLAARGEYKAAVDSYDIAIKIDPVDAGVYYKSEYFPDVLVEDMEARKRYDKALEIPPYSATAYYNKGVALGELGDYRAAVQSFDKAIEGDPASAAPYYARRGIALAVLGEYEEAIESYDKAMEIEPEVVVGYIAKYVFGIAAGFKDTELLQKALELEDREWPYPALRYFAGEISEAEFLTEAGSDAGRLCEAHCYIGYVYKSAGDTVKAREHFGKAVATDQTDLTEYDLAVRELERLGE